MLDNLVMDVRHLDVMRVACAARMSEELGFRLNKFNVSQELDYLTREVVYKFEAFIAGENLKTISYPATWWDALKERWFPAWALNRWPVRKTTFHINALYPEMAIPEQGRISVHRARFMETLRDA